MARGRIEVDPSPIRIVIGFDGSEGARAAVKAVAARNWRRGTEVRLVTATDPIQSNIVGKIIPQYGHYIEEVNKYEHKWLEKAGQKAMKMLRLKGLTVSHHIKEGNPKHILVEAAGNWPADCIFVGANAGGSRIGRFLLGSVSASVAVHSHCSVEVVRKVRKKYVRTKKFNKPSG